MLERLEREIEYQARKLLKRDRKKAWVLQRNQKRFRKRTGKATLAPKPHVEPKHWAVHPHFNPRYCIKHSRFLAKTIWRKLVDKTYQPEPAIYFEIPKPTGGSRGIMVFTIPDAAVSKLMHERLTLRNINKFSPHNYSYRPDRGVFDAIISASNSLTYENAFVIGYDFKKYFDNIDHNYIKKLVNTPDFFTISHVERYYIDAIMRHRHTTLNDYTSRVNMQERKKGVPQGSSISLFLANIAGHELDRDLEKQNGQFVRFADDVLAVTYDYQSALRVRETFSIHCKRAGISINYKKSDGIFLLPHPEDESEKELYQKKHVDFLGHCLSNGAVTLSDSAVKRIKSRISSYLYLHLLQCPRDRKQFDPKRLANNVDWDLVTALNEIRKYVYGGLRHAELRGFIDDGRKLPRMKGLMAFYPLVTSCSKLVQLDGWLLNAIVRAHRERCKCLNNLGTAVSPILKQKLLDGTWYTNPADEHGQVLLQRENEPECPSFVYGWRAARKFYKRYGLTEISPPSYYSLLSLYM